MEDGCVATLVLLYSSHKIAVRDKALLVKELLSIVCAG